MSISQQRFELQGLDGDWLYRTPSLEDAINNFCNCSRYIFFIDHETGYKSSNTSDVKRAYQAMTDFYDQKTPSWSESFGKAYNKEIDAEESTVTAVDNNPKTVAALNKPRLSDVPPVALFAMGAAMSDGASKYGRFNWRDTSVTASVFYDAMMRHLTAWYNGEDCADDSHVDHLGHIMASCAILLDAQVHGVFNDDRDKRLPENLSKHKEYWQEVEAL